MNHQEFVAWTKALEEEGRLTSEQATDVRHQRSLFNDERTTIQREFAGLIVGFVAGHRLIADSTAALLDEAADLYGVSRQIYFEAVETPVPETQETLTPGPDPNGLVELHKPRERTPVLLASRSRFATLTLATLLVVAAGLIFLAEIVFQGSTTPARIIPRVAGVAVLVFVPVLVELVYRRIRAKKERSKAERAGRGD
jgi:hypothetical protein